MAITPLLSVFALIFLVTTEPIYQKFLFDLSIPVIVALQSTATPASVAFMKLVSDIGAMGLIIGVLLISYIFWGRAKAFYYLTFYAEILFIMGIGKMAYHSPRPYMVSDDV